MTAPDDALARVTGERDALARCAACWDDGENTDVGRPMLDKLEALGWLIEVERNQWEITDEGLAALAATAPEGEHG